MSKTKKNETENKTGLELAKAEILKRFGNDALVINKTLPNVEFFSSQSLALDIALGGGWAKGRIHELYGPPSGGKSTTALHAVCQIQSLGEVAAFVDMEHALDPSYARAIGVELEDLLLTQPDNAEQALETVELLVRSSEVRLIVVDSVAALVPRAEIEGEMGDSHMGLQARLMSQALRKLTAITHKADCAIIFINQVRSNIASYGSPTVTSGGNALKFYASQRIEVRRITSEKDSTNLGAIKSLAKIVKNKVAPPFRQAEIQINYGQGFDKGHDLLTLALELGIIERSGSWYNYGDQKLGQGGDTIAKLISNNKELFREVSSLVKEKLQLK